MKRILKGREEVGVHNKCTKVTKGVDIRYINAIFSQLSQITES